MSDVALMVDTNIASHFMRYPEGNVAQRMRSQTVESVGISIIVVSELRFGAAKIKSVKLHNQIEWLLTKMTVLGLDGHVDVAYAELRSHLERQGTPIGANDMFIAAHALALDLPLITDNIREFSRVPNLRVENWLD